MNLTGATLAVRSSTCRPHPQAVQWVAVRTANGPDRGLHKVVPVGAMEIDAMDRLTEDRLA